MKIKLTAYLNDGKCFIRFVDTNGSDRSLPWAEHQNDLTVLGNCYKKFLVTDAAAARAADANADAAAAADAALEKIGWELFAWFARIGANPRGWYDAKDECVLEVQIDESMRTIPVVRDILFDVPWETLADPDKCYLMADGAQPFEVIRRIGSEVEHWRPRHGNMSLMLVQGFRDQGTNRLEDDEEMAIRDGTRGLAFSLAVQRSAEIGELKTRLGCGSPFDALHFDCHGTASSGHGPQLLIGNKDGCSISVSPERVQELLNTQAEVSPLIFLSACETVKGNDGSCVRSTDSFALALVSAGCANVIGFVGSVSVAVTGLLSSYFYRELAQHATVSRAFAVACRELCRAHLRDRRKKASWHMARLYAGRAGGGVLTTKDVGPIELPSADFEGHFHCGGKRKLVLGQAFVGREKETGIAISCLNDSDDYFGALICGEKSVGKSSLAASVASRLDQLRTVVVCGEYSAEKIFSRIVETVREAAENEEYRTWLTEKASDCESVLRVLCSMLENELRERPILLVLDDLDRILDPSAEQSGGPRLIKQEHRGTVCGLMVAFWKCFFQYTDKRTKSRLLVTSCCKFTLEYDEFELGIGLECVSVASLSADELNAAAKLRVDEALDTGREFGDVFSDILGPILLAFDEWGIKPTDTDLNKSRSKFLSNLSHKTDQLASLMLGTSPPQKDFYDSKVRPRLELFEKHGFTPGIHLLSYACQYAESIGDGKLWKTYLDRLVAGYAKNELRVVYWARYALWRGEMETVAEYFEKMMEQREGDFDTGTAAMALLVAFAKTQLGKLNEAGELLGYIEKSFSPSQTYDKDLLASLANRQLADIKCKSGDLDGALAMYWLVLSAIQGLENKREEAITLGCMGAALKAKSELDKARSQYEAQLKLAKTIDASDIVCEATCSLAELAVEQYGGLGEFSPQMNEVLKIAENADNRIAIKRIESILDKAASK